MDLDYHVRHVILPRPGTMEQLEKYVARLHSSLLDRSRPLWEIYVIEGLNTGQVAIYNKMHHAAIDGQAGVAIAKALLSGSAEPSADQTAAPTPAHQPVPLGLPEGFALGPKTPLNVAITNQRSFAARSLPLAAVKQMAKRSGASLNDVVLAICAGALKRYLADHDCVPTKPLIAGVPVSLREAGNTDPNNQVSMMMVNLATTTKTRSSG